VTGACFHANAVRYDAFAADGEQILKILWLIVLLTNSLHAKK
jgi:hypothetical protein